MFTKNIKCSLNKTQYLLGENVVVEIHSDCVVISIKLFKLEHEILADYTIEENTITIPNMPLGGYGISVTTNEGIWEGAFDVVNDYREVIRYGFLSDFSRNDIDSCDVDWIRDLHLNAVQFYDWMYRHDQLLPPTLEYEDPLGRKMSVEAILKKIRKCKEYGIRPIAYGAIYAATNSTFDVHPEWGMYTMDGEPMTFANWLYYMNIEETSGWSSHILEEYKKAIHFGFSGIHMDTYGFPKRVWNQNGHPVDLANEFSNLIDNASIAVRTEDVSGGVIFNAVNNWPMEAIAKSDQDAVYIEVWPPHDSYYDLYSLIRTARLCSGKNVVLAAYLKAFQHKDLDAAERSFRFSWATICASGGTQLVLGEEHGLLRDSYYVNYTTLRPSFLPVVQNYCDYLVRYADLLYNDYGVDISKTASGGINEDICFESDSCVFSPNGKADTVWTIIRESEKRLTIHLINLMGNDDLWNHEKSEPREATGIKIKLRLDRAVSHFCAASPDNPSLQAYSLAYACQQTNEGRQYTVDVPSLQYWTTVWVQLEE